MKIIFAGTPEFAETALKALYAAGHDIVLVLTQPDRPAGRGMQLHASAVKQCAIAHGTPVAQPVSLRLDGKYPEIAREAHELLHATPHDVMVVAAYGLILPPSVLEIPRHGCINIHGSLLPRWRGAAPIHRAIEAGDAVTGVTIMQMEAGLDTGPMLLRGEVPIAADDTTATLHDKVAQLGAALIVDAIAQLESGVLPPPQIQPEAGVTYAAKIGKDEAALDWRLPAAVLARRIRAFNPFPGAAGQCAGATVKIWRARAVQAPTAAPPGTVLAANAHDGVLVACGGDVLELLELQKAGGKRLPAAEFIKGFPLERETFA
ncbi:methionyl-tRNA formyltransferase [Oxalobacteraceae bacterium CAVE-383]|nr:methionyl-tRNA formyltransferase [Oxalobacteraceae bacterium CAVE-383]